MVDSYREAEEYLLNVPRFTKKNNIEDTENFLKALGNPGMEKRIIHIAGTNGKGSVCAYLSSILSEAGYKVGMFSSPHLVEMRERFRINGTPVEEELFTKAFGSVMDKLAFAQEICGSKEYHPTFFELLFLMGMIIFQNKGVDYIILETGLGGRLDATNAVRNPVLTVITEIGMDHMEYLGNTIEEIAGEKAGILKRNVPVVYCDKRREASEVIRKRAETLGIQVFSVGSADYNNITIVNKSIDFSFHSRYYGYIGLSVATKALYQVENAAIAARSAEVLMDSRITQEQIARGIRKTIWEGRMEEVLPGVFVDGAHNEDGIRAFVQTVEANVCEGKQYLLFSVAADKDYEGMIRILKEKPLFELVAAAKLNNERSASLEALQTIFERFAGDNCIFFENVKEALFCLLDRKKKEDYIYIVGSLYLVGEIKTLLRRRTDD